MMKWGFLAALFIMMYIDNNTGHTISWLPKLVFLLAAINVVLWIVL